MRREGWEGRWWLLKPTWLIPVSAGGWGKERGPRGNSIGELTIPLSNAIPPSLSSSSFSPLFPGIALSPDKKVRPSFKSVLARMDAAWRTCPYGVSGIVVREKERGSCRWNRRRCRRLSTLRDRRRTWLGWSPSPIPPLSPARFVGRPDFNLR